MKAPSQTSSIALLNRRQMMGLSAALAGGALLGRAAGALAEPAGAADKPAAPPWQIGCYTRPWDALEYRSAFDGMAEAGYKFAGLMTHKGKTPLVIHGGTTTDEAATVGEEAKKRGLTILSVYAGEFPVEVATGLTVLKRLIDNCAACGCGRLMLGGVGKAELVATYCRVLADGCDYAATKNVSLSVKPHGGQTATGPACRKMVETVGRKNFGLWYDPGNIYYYSDGKVDPVEDAAAVDGLVVGMSVKDFSKGPPKDVNVTPGTGLVRFAELFAKLKKGGFVTGPLVVECTARGDAAKVTAEARKARLFLEELLR